jgi:hypothetical protein
MMRARLLKPGFFTNEELARLPVRARLLFAGLWCLADREGRLEDRPERIKAAIFPYERVRIRPLIAALTRAGIVKSYTVAYTRCLALPSFCKHQRPHPRETPSFLPPPPPPRRAQGVPKVVPGPSGSSVPRSGRDQDQDLKPAALRPVPFRVYAAIASQVLRREHTDDLGALAESFKRACADQALQPGAELTRKAIDAAQTARARRRA